MTFEVIKNPQAQPETELAAAHRRIDMLNERLANIEHYLGLRRHDHHKTDLRWRFHQIQQNIATGERPVEIPTTMRPLRHAA